MAEDLEEFLERSHHWKALLQDETSGTWEDWSEEPGSARSTAQRPDECPETHHWGVPLGPLQIVMSIMYSFICIGLMWLQARKAVLYIEVMNPLWLIVMHSWIIMKE